MSNPLLRADPERAWRPWQPGRWTVADAAHLHRRAGFGATLSQLKDAVRKTPQAALDELFTSPDEAFERQMLAMTPTVTAGNDPRKLGVWWLYKMRQTPTPLREKMTLFWHGHFATSAAKVRKSDLMLQQHLLLGEQALGSFRELALGMSRDPAMLIYLDTTENRKARPNENYAREFMELFCLGEGHYSEMDVQELARCFTGWDVRFGRATFTALHHDRGTKQLLGSSGRFDDEAAVDLVLAHPACGRWIAAKLVRYFVADVDDIPDELLTPLADAFVRSEFDIATLVRTILSSELFFSPSVRARKVKSPLDFALGTISALDAPANYTRVEQAVSRLGQSPFHPPSVKGWSGGLDWINASTLLSRGRFVSQLDLKQVPDLDTLEILLLAQPLPAGVRRSLTALSGIDTLRALAVQPEFHLA